MNTALAVEYKNTGTLCIGFVLMKNDHNQVTCRVAQCLQPIPIGVEAVLLMAGEKTDIQNIMDHGAKMNRAEAMAIFPSHVDEILNNWKK